MADYGTISEINALPGLGNATQPEIDEATLDVDLLIVTYGEHTRYGTLQLAVNRDDLNDHAVLRLIRATGAQVRVNRARKAAATLLSSTDGAVRRVKNPVEEVEYQSASTADLVELQLAAASQDEVRRELRAAGLIESGIYLTRARL